MEVRASTEKTVTVRDRVDGLLEMSRLRGPLVLEPIAAPSTLCGAFDRSETAVRRGSPNTSNGCYQTDGFSPVWVGEKGYENPFGSNRDQ